MRILGIWMTDLGYAANTRVWIIVGAADIYQQDDAQVQQKLEPKSSHG